MPSTSYSMWPPTGLIDGVITCLRSCHKVSSLNGVTNETWNVICTLISSCNSSLYMSLNTHSTMENEAQIFGFDLEVTPSGNVTIFTFNTFLVCLVYIFVSSSINLLFVVCSGFLHQQLGHLQEMFTFLAKSSPSWLNTSIECAPSRARLVGWSASTPYATSKKWPFGSQMCGYIATKLHSTSIVRPISLVHTHQVPQVLVQDFIHMYHFSILLGMKGHAKSLFQYDLPRKMLPNCIREFWISIWHNFGKLLCFHHSLRKGYAVFNVVVVPQLAPCVQTWQIDLPSPRWHHTPLTPTNLRWFHAHTMPWPWRDMQWLQEDGLLFVRGSVHLASTQTSMKRAISSFIVCHWFLLHTTLWWFFLLYGWQWDYHVFSFKTNSLNFPCGTYTRLCLYLSNKSTKLTSLSASPLQTSPQSLCA